MTHVIAHEKIYEKLIKRMSEKARNFRIGDPLDEATDMGPLVSETQRERVEEYIRVGEEEGAKVAVGGRRPGSMKKGFFLEPTILRDTSQEMRVCREEDLRPRDMRL